MDEEPVYQARCAVRSLWQKYRIYDDRLDLDTRFGLMSIPFENIETIEVRPSGLSGFLKGHLQLRDFRPAFKLDWENLLNHVVADTKEGWVHRVFITPDDPHAFKGALDDAMRRFAQGAPADSR